ncbi:MAG: response regulator [Nitrososphaeraceae archaeon]
MMIATQVSKDHYLYPILDKDTSFYHSHNENSNHYQHYHSQPSSSSPPHQLQNQESNTAAVERTWKDPFLKRILIVDDDPDLTLTFKVGLEEYHYYHDDKRRFEIYSYNNPLVAVREFKPHFYDLLLTDIYMPYMNGFELCEKILELDVNVRVCFVSSAEVNIEALREVYPKARSIGCFIKKPVTVEYLAKKLEAELY